MLDVVQFATEQAAAVVAANGRHRPIGQRFTPSAIARFMAKQIRHLPPKIRILDPGAGVGILTAAVCERIATIRTLRSVVAEVWETDDVLLPHLEATLDACRKALQAKGHSFDIKLRGEDFVLASVASARSEGTLFPLGERLPFVDVAILNPPYFKLNATSEYARVMSAFFRGQPNMYASFMALCALRLKPQGTMVALTPRSFCNGLYFKGFRRFLEGRVHFRRFHLFDSRKKPFHQESVLQETVITAASKSPTETVEITSSDCGTFTPMHRAIIPAGNFVRERDSERIIRLPVCEDDVRIIDLFDRFDETFASLGLAISTGPVVHFRSRRWLVDQPNGQRVVPLLWMHNLKRDGIVWPVAKRGKQQYIIDDPDSAWMLVPEGNYVLTKRFSAKEEARRIVASVLRKSDLMHPRIGIENHLNYIYCMKGKMSAELANRVCRWFNSSLVDRYFRIINGNTQVNATEIRTMPMPSLDFLRGLGRLALTDTEIEDRLFVGV